MWSNGFSTAGSVVNILSAIIFLQLASLTPAVLATVGIWFTIPFGVGLIFWGIGFYQWVEKEKGRPSL